MSDTQFTPAEVFPPGEFIREELEARGWSQQDLADILARPPRLVSELIGGKRAVTPETAQGLAQAFGTSAEMWLNLESAYQLSKVKNDGGGVARRARLFALVPLNELIRRGWIQRSENIAGLEQQVCRFLEIESLEQRPPFLAAARKKDASAEWSPAQVSWIARVRQLAKGLDVPGFTQEKLSAALAILRGLRCKAEDLQKVPGVLAKAGIRLVIVEPLAGTNVDGACLWLDGKHPAIGLSFRFDRIDWFWFTLMHEIGHVRYGDGRSEGVRLDVELVGSGARAGVAGKSKEEQRADRFATEFLLDQEALGSFVAEAADRYSTGEILGHAERQAVHAGIVVGQLQQRELVPHSHFRGFLAKVREELTSVAKTDGWGVLHTGKSGSRG